jgi:hypothetical protein
MANGYRLDSRGSILGRGKRFFCTSQRPDRLWVPGARALREADHPVPGSRMVELYLHSPIRLNGFVHN